MLAGRAAVGQQQQQQQCAACGQRAVGARRWAPWQHSQALYCTDATVNCQQLPLQQSVLSVHCVLRYE
jgi:hypothetical protein